ncbi:HD-GYP domain-containing protein [Psychrosphaera sp. 1_MG-2023]|uniref:HD-GYP domain-containing protein n=2 Tax=Psychrosphaera TaxID=907197 RepID=UPI0026E44B40|nr:HD-GYP domain-containing protein [Psychrosphaera sp. 1_MG-2023]MDO6719400.1 HD-GYP domain-containing protein [Psychrosphaera sp. 1_MG-2023]
MKKEISISNLKLGMFVVEVTQQAGKVKIKSQGYVRTQRAIDMLKDKKVERVIVDLAKTLQPKQREPLPELEPVVPENNLKKVDKTPTAGFTQELGRAATLYSTAKNIQLQAFDNMKAGKPIDTVAMKEVADGFIDSVFRNQDALACMTRMREKDSYLIEHSVNVSIVMTIFARHLGLDRDVIHALATGALLHDLGKIGIPDSVLNKPSRLTDEEMDIMRSHVTLGYEVLKRSGELDPISLEVVRDHHEKLDGTGYPNFKIADELSSYARMITIVDTYDAITADRCYQKARNPITAFKILRAESGDSFDEELVTEFISCMGIHPIGTLVKLKSNKLGVVIKSNFINPLCPEVNVFYSLTNKSHIEPRVVNLSASNINDEIERSVKPDDFNIDMIKFFKQVLLP